MIAIKDKSKCCGCSACVNACPVQCISFKEDEQGFRYPKVDLSTCIDCHLCEKACPFLIEKTARTPKKVYSATNKETGTRLASSSGGIFSVIAESIIMNNGVVFGACFNDRWEVIHSYTEKLDGLDSFRRSKYVQSVIGTAFKDVKSFLRAGRLVLFSGTPCQIDGLKHFLQKDYANLYTLEVVCHAVPSPLIWREYLDSVCQKKSISIDKISSISFRNKKCGWKEYSMYIDSVDGVVVHEICSENLYLQGFINNLFIRPSCLNCPSKNGKSGSDFSLADFWAINQYLPQQNDNRGTTLLYANTEKGCKLIENLDIEKTELDFSQNLNIAYSFSTKEKYPIQKFWDSYSSQGLEAIETICKHMKPNAIVVFLRRIKSFINRKLQ